MSIRTVLADIQPAELGRTDYHEHLFQVTPLLAGDELTDQTVALRESELLRDAGIDALIDATPAGLGRNPAALARVSSRTGLAIIATTGFHRSAHYAAAPWPLALTSAQLTEVMVRDITVGMPADDRLGGGPVTVDGHPVRAGLLKVGIDYWRIDDFAARVIEAIGDAHRSTGASVMVHLEHGSAAFEVLSALAAVGVNASAIALAHVDRNPDPGLHCELAQAGAFLGYDGPARHREYPDSAILDCLAQVVANGAGDRILVGGDVARSSRFVATGGMPGMAYLPTRFAPRMRFAVGDEATDLILQSNPRRFLDRFGAASERGRVARSSSS